MILQTPPAAARALCSHEFYLQPPLQACRSWRAPRQHCPAGSSRRPGRRVRSWCSGSTTSPSLPSTRNYFTRPQHYRLLMTRTPSVSSEKKYPDGIYSQYFFIFSNLLKSTLILRKQTSQIPSHLCLLSGDVRLTLILAQVQQHGPQCCSLSLARPPVLPGISRSILNKSSQIRPVHCQHWTAGAPQ